MESLSFLFIPFFSFKRRNCNYKRKSQRANDSELNSVVIISRMADSDEEHSDGEIIFEEKIVVFKNKTLNRLLNHLLHKDHKAVICLFRL